MTSISKHSFSQLITYHLQRDDGGITSFPPGHDNIRYLSSDLNLVFTSFYPRNDFRREKISLSTFISLTSHFMTLDSSHLHYYNGLSYNASYFLNEEAKYQTILL